MTIGKCIAKKSSQFTPSVDQALLVSALILG